jgi:rubrerythrin
MLAVRIEDFEPARAASAFAPAHEDPMNLNWTCPACLARNSTHIVGEARAGRIVAVDCPGCGAEHQASVVFPRAQAGAPRAVGVVWV